MSLVELQKAVDEWIKTYGVRYFDPMTNMACLTEEVGEVARLMARMYGEQSFKQSEQCSEETQKQKLADELMDVMWVVTCLANQTGVDLTAAFKRNMEKKTSRDKGRFCGLKEL